MSQLLKGNVLKYLTQFTLPIRPEKNCHLHHSCGDHLKSDPIQTD